MPRTPVQMYRWRKWVLPLLLVAYAVVATTRDKEVFPIFSWNLFARVPTRAERYHVVLTSLNGEPVENYDVFLNRGALKERGISIPLNRDGIRILKTVGRCLEYPRTLGPCDARLQAMEGLLFPNTQSASYRVERLLFNPLKLLLEGKVRERVTVAKFNYGSSTP